MLGCDWVCFIGGIIDIGLIMRLCNVWLEIVDEYEDIVGVLCVWVCVGGCGCWCVVVVCGL